MTKAAQKRRQDSFNTLSAYVGRVLIDFKNRYYQSYSDWNISQIELRLNEYPTEATVEEAIEKYLNQETIQDEIRIPEFFQRYGYRRKGGKMERHSVKIEKHMIEHAMKLKSEVEKTLSRKALLQHKYLNEAAEGYQKKFDRMIEKLVDEGFVSKRLSVKEIGTFGDKLEFLVSNEDKECHARAIWVEGSIKAPHYRFITTVRKK